MIWAALDVIEALDRAAQWHPLWRMSRAQILDTLFGPAEDFEFVSRTAPQASDWPQDSPAGSTC